MTLRVNTNVAALNAHRNVQKVNADSVKNLERLSSGMRINTAADGPANLVVSEIMRSQISGLKQAVENSENGVSMVQTAEGALSEVNRLLISLSLGLGSGKVIQISSTSPGSKKSSIC